MYYVNQLGIFIYLLNPGAGNRTGNGPFKNLKR